MTRRITRTAAGLLTIGLTLSSASAAAPYGFAKKVTEYPASVSFEYDITMRMGDYDSTYADLWKTSMSVCDARGGYISEYNDGLKRSYIQPLLPVLPMNTYVTCLIPDGTAQAPTEHQPEPEVWIGHDTGLNSVKAMISAVGEKRAAYKAAREKAYQTCLKAGRRVRSMSIAYKKQTDETDFVDVTFICNSGIKTTRQKD